MHASFTHVLTNITDVNKPVTASENINYQYLVVSLPHARPVNQFSTNSRLQNCDGGGYTCVFTAIYYLDFNQPQYQLLNLTFFRK